MEIQKLGIIWFIILFHGMMWRAHADFNRPGFITIDCGNEAPGTPNHMSEADFTDTGISVQLPPDFRTDDPLYETVRSFPYGKRNCYTLTPTGGKDNRYLIRARFIYGNYDSKNSTPVFNLYVGVNLWTKVNLTSINQNLFQEIIYKPTTDFIPVCLVDIGQGTPFISSLELRPLNNDIYNLSSSMIMVRRYDTSEKTSTTLRTYKSYEDDDYDRLWAPYLNEQSQQYWTTEKANASLKDVKENNYRLPKPIFEAEAVPKYGEGLSIMFNYLLDSSDYYVYWHFAQTEVGYREFDINLKKNTIDLGTFTLPYLQEYTIFTLEPIKLNEGETTLDFDIAKTDASKLPPILNAIELFRDLKLSQLATHQDDVDAMMDLKKYYKSTAIKGWQGDPCLPIVPWDGVICSNTTSVPPRVTSLDLTSKGLAGDILSSLSNLTSLNYLNLSNNSLTGKIPEVLADMPSLKFLDLGGNKLSGSVPVKLLDRQQNGSLSLRLDGNPDLCTSKACSEKKKNRKLFATILIAAGAVTLFLLVIVAALFAYKWHRKTGSISRLKSKNQQFSHYEIVTMTSNFSTELGQGGFGTVYLGSLKDGTQVAVKMLKKPSGLKSFQTEAELLMRVHHRNLVSLVGYCDEAKTTALIYEYMAKGDVNKHLSAQQTNTSSWIERLQISCDAAQGLEYLHTGCASAIIHRDIKTANILLDDNLRAKVADLGMSRIFSKENTNDHITVEYVAGTIGYLDPEYQNTCKLNEKSDVYSFGVVLLELMTGRPPIIKSTSDSHVSIITWVRSFFERAEIHNILDQSFGGDYSENSAWKAVEIAMACVSSIGIQRPTMSEVLAELKECLTLEKARKGADRDRQPSSRGVFDIVHIDSEASMGPSAR